MICRLTIDPSKKLCRYADDKKPTDSLTKHTSQSWILYQKSFLLKSRKSVMVNLKYYNKSATTKFAKEIN